MSGRTTIDAGNKQFLISEIEEAFSKNNGSRKETDAKRQGQKDTQAPRGALSRWLLDKAAAQGVDPRLLSPDTAALGAKSTTAGSSSGSAGADSSIHIDASSATSLTAPGSRGARYTSTSLRALDTRTEQHTHNTMERERDTHSAAHSRSPAADPVLEEQLGVLLAFLSRIHIGSGAIGGDSSDLADDDESERSSRDVLRALPLPRQGLQPLLLALDATHPVLHRALLHQPLLAGWDSTPTPAEKLEEAGAGGGSSRRTGRKERRERRKSREEASAGGGSRGRGRRGSHGLSNASASGGSGCGGSGDARASSSEREERGELRQLLAAAVGKAVAEGSVAAYLSALALLLTAQQQQQQQRLHGVNVPVSNVLAALFEGGSSAGARPESQEEGGAAQLPLAVPNLFRQFLRSATTTRKKAAARTHAHAGLGGGDSRGAATVSAFLSQTQSESEGEGQNDDAEEGEEGEGEDRESGTVDTMQAYDELQSLLGMGDSPSLSGRCVWAYFLFGSVCFPLSHSH